MKHNSVVLTPVAKKLMVLAIALLALMAFSAVVYAGCTTYSNSRVVYFGGQATCAYTGNGCTECTNGDGGSCVTNGSYCSPFSRDPNP